ncbi:hypothetical protein Hanom_Chr04g00347361 [Helianthus anomalus]
MVVMKGGRENQMKNNKGVDEMNLRFWERMKCLMYWEIPLHLIDQTHFFILPQ